jgi:hypothetical protein
LPLLLDWLGWLGWPLLFLGWPLLDEPLRDWLLLDWPPLLG